MSRGPGRVQRFILDAVAKNPHWWAVGTLASLYADEHEITYTQALGDSFRRAARRLHDLDLAEVAYAPIPTRWHDDGTPIRATTREIQCVAAPGTDWDPPQIGISMFLFGFPETPR